MASSKPPTHSNGRAANGHTAAAVDLGPPDYSNGHTPLVPRGTPAVRHATIGDIARLLNAELVGDDRTLITGCGGAG